MLANLTLKETPQLIASRWTKPFCTAHNFAQRGGLWQTVSS